MRTFRCKQCGSLYEAVPTVCVCGNNNLSMWEAMDPSGGYPQYGYPAQPANNGWQQPVNSTQQQAPAAPQWQQPAYATPQPPAPQRQTGGGKKKNTALIAVILAVVLIGLGVGGYFLWQHFSGDSPSSSQDDDDKEKDGDKDKNKDAEKDDDGKEDVQETDGTPYTLSGKTVTYEGVTIIVPDGFEAEETEDGSLSFRYADTNMMLVIKKGMYREDFDTHKYDKMSDFIKSLYEGFSGAELKNVKDYTINGHRAASCRIHFNEGSINLVLENVAIEKDDCLIDIYFSWSDSVSAQLEQKLQASLNSITVQS